MNSQDSHQSYPWHYGELDDNNFQFHGHVLLLILTLSSILLLFTLVFLYARWACRYRDETPTTTTAPAANTTSSVGLDKIVIDSLPITLHRSSEEAQCSICLSAFQDQEKVKTLPGCNHCYHPDCVDEWLSTQSSCPLCRASLQIDSAVS